jgi:hypothetical protein
MDYLNSYEWINQGSMQKIDTIQKVSVHTHKMINIINSNNMSRNVIQNIIT